MIKLVLGGFPCTEFSIAQKVKRINKIDFTADEFISFRNSHKDWWLHISEFENQIGEKLKKNGDFPQDEKYEFALGLQLFLNCLVAYDRMVIEAEKTGDNVYYFFENVNSMKKEIKEVMEEILSKLYGGVMNTTNSALVSAQNRKRIYFTNFGDIEQPEDRGVLLKDILDTNVMNEQTYCLRYERTDYAKEIRKGYENGEIQERMCNLRQWHPRQDGKTNTITTVQKDNMIIEPIVLNDVNGKAGTLRATCYKDGIRNMVANNVDKRTCVAEPVKLGEIGKGCQGNRIYSADGKSVTIQSQSGGLGSNTGLYAVPIIASKQGKNIDKIDVDKSLCLLARDYKGFENQQMTALLERIEIETEELDNGYYKGNQDTNVFGKIISKNTSDNNGQPAQCCRIYKTDNKSVCLDGDSRKYIFVEHNENYKSTNKPITIYEVKDGQITIKGEQYPVKLPDGYYIIRNLTVSECRRLQTIPDWYVMNCSKSQNYKMLGNGWTNEVVIHYLSHIPNIDSEEIEVLSLYDGMSGGMIALTELGCDVKKYVAYEIDKYAIQTTKDNFDIVEHRGDAFAVRDENWIY